MGARRGRPSESVLAPEYACLVTRPSFPKPKAHVRPPNKPWVPLQFPRSDRGCLSAYLSDDLSPLPVRAVTRPGDNKSDPNLETRTFGLFSTCERQMRSSAVKRRLHYIFFVTNHGGDRVLSGYYRIRWYTDGVLGGDKADYALAADFIRFVDPILLRDLPASVRIAAQRWSRNFLLMDDKQTEVLLQALDTQPDRTDAYLQEIDRLERFNQFHTGYRCWNEQEPFSWEMAKRYLRPAQKFVTSALIPNTSPTNHWMCEACGKLSMNKSLLKSCPSCKSMGSLRPARTEEASTIKSA